MELWLFFVSALRDQSGSAVKERPDLRSHLAVVACGPRLEETLTMLKSAVLLSKKPLHFYIFAEDELHDSFRNAVSAFPCKSATSCTAFCICNLHIGFLIWEDIHVKILQPLHKVEKQTNSIFQTFSCYYMCILLRCFFCLCFLKAGLLAQDNPDQLQIHHLPHHFSQWECKGVEEALQTLCLSEALPPSGFRFILAHAFH